MIGTEKSIMEDGPLSPRSIKLVLRNLFRKESDGGPIEFFIRRLLVPDDEKHLATYSEIREIILECGGCLFDNPRGNHSIELAFSEVYNETSAQAPTRYIFNVNYIKDCQKYREILDLEDYRIGDYNPAEVRDANDVMKGLKCWSEVRFSTMNQQGVKLPGFGCTVAPSGCLESTELKCLKKKFRSEFTYDEDCAILRYLLRTKTYSKVGGNVVWKEMEKEFQTRSYHSLQNRFKRSILPNIENYKELSEAEKNQFRCLTKNSSGPEATEPVNSVSSTSSFAKPSTTFPRRKTPSKQREDSPEKSTVANSNPPKSHGEHAEISSANLSPPMMSSTKLLTAGDALEAAESPLASSSVPRTDGFADEVSLILPPSQKTTKKPTGPENEPALPTPQNSDPPKTHEDRERPQPAHISDSVQPDVEREGKTTPVSTEQIKVTKRSTDSTKPLNRSSSVDSTSTDSMEMNNSNPSDRRILGFIIENERFEEIHGHSLWEEIRTKLFSGAEYDWQAIKRRFFETIINDVNLGKHELDDDTLARFRKVCPLATDEKTSCEEDSDSSIETVDFEDGVSSTPIKPRLQKASATSGSTTYKSDATSNIPKRSYNRKEDQRILDYIIRTGRFNEVRGLLLWRDMSSALHEMQRSSESLKTRYLKTIVKNLSQYDLTKSVVQKINAGLVEQRNLGGARRREQESCRSSARVESFHGKSKTSSNSSSRIENARSEATASSSSRREPPASSTSGTHVETTRRKPPASSTSSRREPPASSTSGTHFETTRREPPASSTSSRREPPASSTSGTHVETTRREPPASSTLGPRVRCNSDDTEFEKPRVRPRKRPIEEPKHPALIPGTLKRRMRTKKLYTQPPEPVRIEPVLSSTRIYDSSPCITSRSPASRTSCSIRSQHRSSKPTSSSSKTCTLDGTLRKISLKECAVVLRRLPEPEIFKQKSKA